MIEIKPINSSSKGNCYAINDGKTPLLLECGISIKRIKRAFNFSLSTYQGCLVTHEHGDHSKAVKDIMKAGIDCYMSFGTAHKLEITSHRLKTIDSMTQFNIGTWSILPFDSIHDAMEPLNFLLKSGDEKVLFITDSAYCKYQFIGITRLMIECNYISDILYENIAKGIISENQKNRLLYSHFSLENVLDFLRANDLSKLKEIYLMHLSDTNSDAARMKEEVMRATGKPTIICEA